MSNTGVENRMISTCRNIRQRCHLKYSKHGVLTWDKWTEYEGIFSSFLDTNGIQHNQLELHSKHNIHQPNGKIIDLKQLRSLTCEHGGLGKNEPRNIIILKIGGKKHRLGFDNVNEYNQWKSLLDSVYESTWDMTGKYRVNDDKAANMLYDSANATRYRVDFADLATQEILSLPYGACELVCDADKIVIEQRNDRQYTFPRSTMRSIRFVKDDQLEFELGSRAPVQGCIRFRFPSSVEARSCYSQWNQGITTVDTPNRERYSVKHSPRQIEESRVRPCIIPVEQQYNSQSPRPSSRGVSTRNPYYNTQASVLSSTTHVTQNEYSAFHTLV